MSGVVLVVEDDRELRELVRRYLERAGHPVHTTASGAEALGLLASDGVELVVLDLGLPDVDGREVLAAAHGGTPGREVPVVVLTARSAVEDRIDGLRRGADDYVTKPFSPTELVLRVQAVLHRTRAVAAAPGPVAFGGGRLRIDEVRHEVRVDGAPVVCRKLFWPHRSNSFWLQCDRRTSLGNFSWPHLAERPISGQQARRTDTSHARWFDGKPPRTAGAPARGGAALARPQYLAWALAGKLRVEPRRDASGGRVVPGTQGGARASWYRRHRHRTYRRSCGAKRSWIPAPGSRTSWRSGTQTSCRNQARQWSL